MGKRMLHTVLCDCDLDLWPKFLKNRTCEISPTFFDAAIYISSMDCIWMLKIVAYYFWVTVTFASDLSCMKFCLEHIFYFVCHSTPKFSMWIHRLPVVCRLVFLVSVTSTSYFNAK